MKLYTVRLQTPEEFDTDYNTPDEQRIAKRNLFICRIAELLPHRAEQILEQQKETWARYSEHRQIDITAEEMQMLVSGGVLMTIEASKTIVTGPERLETTLCAMRETLQHMQSNFEAQVTASANQDNETYNERLGLQMPGNALTVFNEFRNVDDICTDELQSEWIAEGWRVVACCPQPDQRRPDYILGRYSQKHEETQRDYKGSR